MPKTEETVPVEQTQTAQPQTEPPQSEQAPAGEPAQEEKTPQAPPPPPRPKKDWGGFFLPILTVLLILVGICEAFVCAFLGISLFRGLQAQKAAEGQSEQSPTQSAGTTSFSGPTLTIENGTVIRQEEREPASSASGTADQTGQTSGEEEKPVTRLAVPTIHYVLADQKDGETPSASQPKE